MVNSLTLAPESGGLPKDLLRLAAELTREACATGARAAILFGSYARGAALPESDVDLTFVGPDRESSLERREGYLFSLDWRSMEKFRQTMRNPEWGPGSVQGLRRSMVLWDPGGVAAGLKAEAAAWNWDEMSERCDLWAAEQLTSLAEDVQRAVGQFRRKGWMGFVLKGMLSARLAMILSHHLRILYDSENEVWDLVCHRLGQPWAGLQAAAFCSKNEDQQASFEATMKMYSYSVEMMYERMDQRQRLVACGACEAAGYPPKVNA